jgi:phenylpyruvate tautomerase PptA (4-oxalocrotonate tautomerase family)
VPLIEIHALRPTEGVDRVLGRVSAEVAAVLGARPEAVWVTWSTIDGGYAVGGDIRAEQPQSSHAPIVHVHARRTAAEVEAMCEAIERVLVEELGLADGNVFVTVAPVQALG